MDSEQLENVVREHGPWTAMAIRLSDGSYTKDPAPDYRLRRLLQIAADLLRKPLSQCRVLDLACLEGHYAIEFALHGAEVVGIEGRASSVAKCEFVKADLGLTRASFFQDDVRNLTREKYGVFDLVICSGLLYHLAAKDAYRLLEAMFEVTAGLVLIDTFVALTSQRTVEVGGAVRHGHIYGEHDPTETAEQRAKKLWASLDNESSFWFTEPSLINMLSAVGFSSSVEVLGPTMPGNMGDRRTYVAIKRPRVKVLSSELTNSAAHPDIPEGPNLNVDASQRPRSAAFVTAKRLLPQPVKNAIKPLLRGLKILPQDGTPEFMRKPRS
jgi:SAM-dependent methyltransferase